MSLFQRLFGRPKTAGIPVIRKGMRIEEVIALLGDDYTSASLGEALAAAVGVIGGPGGGMEQRMVSYLWDHPAGTYEIQAVDGVVTEVRTQPSG